MALIFFENYIFYGIIQRFVKEIIMSLNNTPEHQDTQSEGIEEVADTPDSEVDTEVQNAIEGLEASTNDNLVALGTLRLNPNNNDQSNETNEAPPQRRTERLRTYRDFENYHIDLDENGEPFFQSKNDGARIDVVDHLGNQVVPSSYSEYPLVMYEGALVRVISVTPAGNYGIAVPEGYYVENNSTGYVLRPIGYTPEEQNFDFI